MIRNFASKLKEKKGYVDNVFSISYRIFFQKILHNNCRHTDSSQLHNLLFHCIGSDQMENKQLLHKKCKIFPKNIEESKSLIYVWLTLLVNILEYYFEKKINFQIISTNHTCVREILSQNV